jgi:hypothetical protein
MHQQAALAFFLPDQTITRQDTLGRGNVNDTWYVKTATGETFVLQRLNPHVFPNPGLVQDNLVTITSHLHSQCQNISTHFIPLRLCLNPSGAHSYIAPDGSWWRLLTYIENSRVVATVKTAEQAREIGRGLAVFHTLTASLDPASLGDPLPGFHCIPHYFDEYTQICGRTEKEDTDCRKFINQRSNQLARLEHAAQKGEISTRVVHADPKAANFLFSKDGHQVISLIDLDTVRSGLLLHDLGDCLRSCCNRAGEEQYDPAEISFDPDFFAAVLTGYAPFAAKNLTACDRELLVESVRLISFELGLRFYTDHLAGNQYFKVEHPRHNLFRARAQFALVRSIEEQYSTLTAISSHVLKTVSAV